MKLWHLILAGLLVWWFFLRSKPVTAAATATAAPGAAPAGEAQKPNPGGA